MAEPSGGVPQTSARGGARLRLLLLGPMLAQDARCRDVLPRVRKTRAVLAILGLATPRPVLRDELTSLLWSRRARPQALASLRQCVHELQEMLLPLSEGMLRSDRSHLALTTESLWVDVHALSAAGGESLALLRGPLLQDLIGLDPEFDRWLAAERGRIAALARAAAEQVLNGEAGPEAAIAAANRLILAEPVDENAWRAIMSAQAQMGDRAAAELAFERCAAALSASAGTTPSAETRSLLNSIREPETAPPLPAQRRGPGLRLGVLPLRRLDGAGEDPLSLGLAEEITTALSRFRWISCIASTSLERLMGQSRGSSSWWEGLDLDFLLDGAVQQASGRVRVNMRLLDLRVGGEVVWARRFDREATDLLSLQDEVAAETVAQIDPELLLREGSRAVSRTVADPTAYDLMLRAIPAVYRLEESVYTAAGEMLASAVELDPNNAAAHAWWAYWHLFLVGQGWAADPAQAMARAELLAEKAIILDPGDARALTLAGHVRAFLHRRVEEGIALHEQALSLNPNLALAWIFSSLAYTYAGRPREALESARKAKRLAPLDPHGFMIDSALMWPHLVLGEYELAAEIGRRATGVAPGFTANWKLYLSTLGHLGRTKEAESALKHLLELEPGFTVRSAVERSPLLRPEDLAIYAEGLRLAGLEE
jgi:DNA-binding SARP family transcriptional activator